MRFKNHITYLQNLVSVLCLTFRQRVHFTIIFYSYSAVINYVLCSYRINNQTFSLGCEFRWPDSRPQSVQQVRQRQHPTKPIREHLRRCRWTLRYETGNLRRRIRSQGRFQFGSTTEECWYPSQSDFYYRSTQAKTVKILDIWELKKGWWISLNSRWPEWCRSVRRFEDDHVHQTT